jgi:hypothetical protein
MAIASYGPWRAMPVSLASSDYESMYHGFMVDATLKDRLNVHCDFRWRPKIIGWIIGREWVSGFLPSQLLSATYCTAWREPIAGFIDQSACLADNATILLRRALAASRGRL